MHQGKTKPHDEPCGFFVSAADVKVLVAAGCESFGEVDGLLVAELVDLLAATEAVGDDEGAGRGGVDGGEQVMVGDGFGDFELVGFKPEWPGHAAAAGLDGLTVAPALRSKAISFVGPPKTAL